MKFRAFSSTILIVWLGNILVTSNTIDINSFAVIENLSKNDIHHSYEPVTDDYEFLDKNSQLTLKEYLNPPCISNVKT